MESTWTPFFERTPASHESALYSSDQTIVLERLQPYYNVPVDGINHEVLGVPTQLCKSVAPEFTELSWSTLSNGFRDLPTSFQFGPSSPDIHHDVHLIDSYLTEQLEQRQNKLSAGWGFIKSDQTKLGPHKGEQDTVDMEHEHSYNMDPRLTSSAFDSDLYTLLPPTSASGKTDGEIYETDLAKTFYQSKPEPVSVDQLPMARDYVHSDSWCHLVPRKAAGKSHYDAYQTQFSNGYGFAQPYTRQDQYDVSAISTYGCPPSDSIDSMSSINSAESGYWSRSQSSTAASSISPMASDTGSSVSVRISKTKRSRISRQKRDCFTPESGHQGECSDLVTKPSFEPSNSNVGGLREEGTPEDHLTIRPEAGAYCRPEKTPEPLKDHNGALSENKCLKDFHDSERDQRADIAAVLLGRCCTEVEAMEDRTTDLPEYEITTSSSADDGNDYRTALDHFRLWEALQRAEEAESDLAPDPVDTAGYNDGGFNTGGSLSSNISCATSSQSGSTPATNTSAPTIGSGSSDSSIVKVATNAPLGVALKPRDLICWHAAKGTKCKGQTGRSHEVRRLYSSVKLTTQPYARTTDSSSDHSMSKKTSNNHRLSAPCARCGLIFSDDVQAAEHMIMMKSDPSCPIRDAVEVSKLNALTEPGGITQKTDVEIAKALKDFKGSKSKAPKLPKHCDVEHFTPWVATKEPLYIGGSNTSKETAMKELSLWYIYFCVLFPSEQIPNNPFAESSVHKYRRLLDLLKSRLEEAADNQTMRRFTAQEEKVFGDLFNDATNILELEMIEEQSRKGSTKGTSKKRRRLDEGSAASPSTPAPSHITDEAKQRYRDLGVLTAPSPGTAMGPPQSPAYCDYTTPGVPPRTPAVSYMVPQPFIALPAFQPQGDEFEGFMNWSGDPQPRQS